MRCRRSSETASRRGARSAGARRGEARGSSRAPRPGGARTSSADTVPFAAPAQPHPLRAKMWMLHAFGSKARQTELRSISACESPFSTATCAAAGLPTTHSPLASPGGRGRTGAGSLERWGESGRSDGRELPQAQGGPDHTLPRADRLLVRRVLAAASGRRPGRRTTDDSPVARRSLRAPGWRSSARDASADSSPTKSGRQDACTEARRDQAASAPPPECRRPSAPGAYADPPARPLHQVVAERGHGERDQQRDQVASERSCSRRDRERLRTRRAASATGTRSTRYGRGSARVRGRAHGSEAAPLGHASDDQQRRRRRRKQRATHRGTASSGRSRRRRPRTAQRPPRTPSGRAAAGDRSRASSRSRSVRRAPAPTRA